MMLVLLNFLRPSVVPSKHGTWNMSSPIGGCSLLNMSVGPSLLIVSFKFYLSLLMLVFDLQITETLVVKNVPFAMVDLSVSPCLAVKAFLY